MKLSSAGESAESPQVALDAYGDAVATWARSSGGTYGSGYIVEAISRAAGGAWQEPIKLSAAGENAHGGQVALDAGGDAVAVWLRSDGTNEIVEATSRAAGWAWQEPIKLSAAGENAGDPHLALDAQGDGVAVWQRYNGSVWVVEAASRPPGGVWDEPVKLSPAGKSAIEPAVALDAEGDAVAVWMQQSGPRIGAEAASRAAGGTWQEPVDVSGTGENAIHPEVALDTQGDAVVVWQRLDSVEAATRAPGGLWQEPVKLSTAGEKAQGPQLALDAQGDAVVVWERSNEAVEATSRAAGGAWQEPVKLSAAGEGAYETQVAVDAEGDAVAVWLRSNGSNEIVEAASRAAGGSWQPPVEVSDASGPVVTPQVALDAQGDAVAVWPRYTGNFWVVEVAAYSVPAPTVMTGAASAISRTSATLNAAVDPEGEEVTACRLEYGTTTSYGQSEPCSPPPGSGEAAVSVSALAAGLEANTTYHFRVVATNAGGTSYGEDETYTTLPNPPTVVTGAASAISRTSATLNGTVNPEGKEVTACRVEYGTTIFYGTSEPCSPSPGSGSSPVAVFTSLTGLHANTTYYFRVVATNAGGTSEGLAETFTTLPNPPTVVTGAASAISRTSATLNAAVDPEGEEVTACRIEYGTTTSYGQSEPCSPPPGSGEAAVSVSALAAGLEANTTYYFRVVATNAGGTSEGLGETFTTLPNPPTVTGVSPDAGLEAGGTEVTITGTELSEATEVTFGSTSATSFKVNSPTSITTVAPPEGPEKTVHVTVANRGGTSTTSQADQFTYVPAGPGPAIAKVSPKKGPAAGGTSVTITGTSFVGVTAVKFGATEARSYTINSPTSVTAISPTETTGTLEVSLTTPNGTSGITRKDRFKYGSPTVMSVDPSTGSKAGGTMVTVTGSGFALGSATIFKFGGALAILVDCASTTECTALSPAAAKTGTVDVRAAVSQKTSKRDEDDRFAYD